METHRFGIGHLETRCTALAGSAAASRMRAALDEALSGALPRALAQELEPVLDGLDGVVRIRRLSLRLDLGDRFQPGGIAAGLAARLAAALRAALAGFSGDVRLWPDHASYVAAYILWRLGIAPGPDWPFAELAKLGHLPAERAAAELIRARPDVLLPLAREAARLGAPDAPVARWPEAAQADLVLALLEPAPSPAESAAVLPAFGMLAPLMPPPGTARSGATLAAAPTFFPPRAAIIAAAALLAATAGASRKGVGVAQLPEALPAAPPNHRHDAALGRALGFVRGDQSRRAVLADLLARHPSRRDRAAKPAGRDRARPRKGSSEATLREAARTPFAGLGLLWPAAVATGATTTLGHSLLAQAVWQVLDRADWEAAAADPALALLFPFDPREIDLGRLQPAPPDPLAARLDPAARAVSAAAPEGFGWSALLLGDFASRLRGLRGASHPWLRDQFLRRAGSVERAGEATTLRLDPVPLAVVLRMAGLHGVQMRLPHEGAPRLVIDLGGAG